jgi:hypothetical protein
MIDFIYTKLKFRSQTQFSPASSCLIAPRTIPWIKGRPFELVSGSTISGSNGDEEKERLKKFQLDRERTNFLKISDPLKWL